MKMASPICSSEATCQSIDDFLAKGGRITTVDPGVTGEDDSKFNWNQSRYPLDVKREKHESIRYHAK